MKEEGKGRWGWGMREEEERRIIQLSLTATLLYLTCIHKPHQQSFPPPPHTQPSPKEECSASVKLKTERLNKHNLNKQTVNTEQQHDMQHVAKLARH